MSETKFFIANLKFDFADEQVKQFFSQFGKLKEFKIVREKESGRSKGFGFLSFENAEDAQALKNYTNASEGKIEMFGWKNVTCRVHDETKADEKKKLRKDFNKKHYESRSHYGASPPITTGGYGQIPLATSAYNMAPTSTGYYGQQPEQAANYGSAYQASAYAPVPAPSTDQSLYGGYPSQAQMAATVSTNVPDQPYGAYQAPVATAPAPVQAPAPQPAIQTADAYGAYQASALQNYASASSAAGSTGQYNGAVTQSAASFYDPSSSYGAMTLPVQVGAPAPQAQQPQMSAYGPAATAVQTPMTAYHMQQQVPIQSQAAGLHPSPEHQSKLFLKNLPADTEVRKLVSFLESQLVSGGKVLKANIQADKKPGVQWCFAHVEFENPSDALVILQMTQQGRLQMDGRNVLAVAYRPKDRGSHYGHQGGRGRGGPRNDRRYRPY